MRIDDQSDGIYMIWMIKKKQNRALPKKEKVEVLSHTRLQPDDRECRGKGNRLNGFQIFARVVHLAKARCE